MVVDALVGGRSGGPARAELAGLPEIVAPCIVTAEATSAIRALAGRGRISSARARGALDALASVRTRLYPFEPFADRAWQLRDNLTVYDAWYVALAEALQVPLITADRRLATAAGPRCQVRLVTA